MWRSIFIVCFKCHISPAEQDARGVLATFRVRRFNRDTIAIGEVKLGVYRMVEEKIVTESGDPVERMVAILEREEKMPGDYVVVQHIESSRVFGESLSKERRSGLLLFPTMTRLKRLAIIRAEDLAEAEGAYRLKEGALSWIDIAEDVYVYDASVEAPENVVAIILETENGRRMIRLGSLTHRGSSYSQDLPGLSDGSSASSSDEGSSPSS